MPEAVVDAPKGVALAPLSGEALRSLLNAAWEGLGSDSGAWIMVVREDGILVYANASVFSDYETTEARAIGRPVAEILPECIAAERTACYARVMRDQSPLFVEGIIGGSLVRCALRPIPPETPDGMAHLLCVSRRIGPDAGPCPEPRIRAQSDDLGALALLSDREIEVLKLIGRGYTTAQIGKELHRSVKTIEWHRVSLGAKLGVSNRVELAIMAIRFGLASAFDQDPGREADEEVAVGADSAK